MLMILAFESPKEEQTEVVVNSCRLDFTTSRKITKYTTEYIMAHAVQVCTNNLNRYNPKRAREFCYIFSFLLHFRYILY